MHTEGVAIIPRCAECEAHWLPADDEHWRAYVTDDEPARTMGIAFTRRIVLHALLSSRLGCDNVRCGIDLASLCLRER
jgi:hypothetical protein